MSRYSIYSSSFTDGSSPFAIKQARGRTITPTPTRAEVVPGGAVDRASSLLSHADPVVRLDTPDLATVLASVSPTVGYYASSGATFRAQKRVAGGVFASAGNHVTISSSKGMVIPDRLTCSQDDPQGAMISLVYYPLSSDGLTAPLTFATAQNLSDTPAFVSQYFLGPVYAGSSQLAGLNSIDVAFGLTYSAKRHDGDVFAREGSITARLPVVRLTFDSIEHASSVGLFHGGFTDDVVIYLRKGSSNGVRVSDSTEGHVSITISAGTWHAADQTGSDGDADEALTVEIIPTGTIAVSTAAALSS